MLLGDPYFSDLGQFYDILAAIQKRQERTQSTKREKKSTFIFVLRCFAFLVTFQVSKLFSILRCPKIPNNA